MSKLKHRRQIADYMQRFLTRPVLAIAIIVLVGGAGAGWWWMRSDHKLSFRTAVVKHGDVAATISATGTIEPIEVVDVGAQVAGLIKAFGTDAAGKTIDYGSGGGGGALPGKNKEAVYCPRSSVA